MYRRAGSSGKGIRILFWNLLLIAASMLQGIFVVPKTKIPLSFVPTPSICTKNSFITWIEESFLSPPERSPHKASISSMKMIAGLLSRASPKSDLMSLFIVEKKLLCRLSNVFRNQVRRGNGQKCAVGFSSAGFCKECLSCTRGLKMKIENYSIKKNSFPGFNPVLLKNVGESGGHDNCFLEGGFRVGQSSYIFPFNVWLFCDYSASQFIFKIILIFSLFTTIFSSN